MGLALLDIQSPGKAVEAFQEALDLNPTNALLAVRIGRALVATHDYRRACVEALPASPQARKDALKMAAPDCVDTPEILQIL